MRAKFHVNLTNTEIDDDTLSISLSKIIPKDHTTMVWKDGDFHIDGWVDDSPKALNRFLTDIWYCTHRWVDMKMIIFQNDSGCWETYYDANA